MTASTSKNSDNIELAQRTVLVTGASRGIGRAIALTLTDAGYALALHYHRSAKQAAELLATITASGGKARLLQFDVGNREQCREALEADIEEHGAYYGVVSNAGVIRDGAFPALSGEDWDNVIHTNLDSFYNVLHPITMPMVRRRKPGRIITMASISGVMGNRGQTNYSASKAGIIAASKSLALELAKREITVNCIAPGLIETEMSDQAVKPQVLEMIPARRVGTGQEVASLVKYLLSDDAAYITRQVISVNGGMC